MKVWRGARSSEPLPESQLTLRCRSRDRLVVPWPRSETVWRAGAGRCWKPVVPSSPKPAPPLLNVVGVDLQVEGAGVALRHQRP